MLDIDSKKGVTPRANNLMQWEMRWILLAAFVLTNSHESQTLMIRRYRVLIACVLTHHIAMLSWFSNARCWSLAFQCAMLYCRFSSWQKSKELWQWEMSDIKMLIFKMTSWWNPCECAELLRVDHESAHSKLVRKTQVIEFVAL